MSKKLFGGVSLLFVVTLLVLTNSAYSHENRYDWYEITIDYKCLSGEIAYSVTTWDLVKWTDSNHPPRIWREVTECWYEYDWDKLEYVRKCENKWTNHPYHYIIHRVYEDYKTITRSATPNRCRRFR